MKAHTAASPSKQDCIAAWEAGRGSIIYSVEPADLLTPVSAYMRLAHLEGGTGQYTLLLESVEGGVTRGRYSVIALRPDLVWTCHNGKVSTSTCHNGLPAKAVPDEGTAPLASLRALIHASRMDLPPELPPMIGGLFGYLGYDMVRQMEHLPDAPPDDLNLPESILMRPGLFAVFDTVTDELILATPVRPNAADTAPEAWERAQALLQSARDCLSGALPSADIPANVPAFAEPTSTFTHNDFCAAITRIQDYIAAGDAFQVVPSQRFSTAFALPSLSLYRALRRINPAPFLFHLDFGGFSLVGSSPEILVRLRDGKMTVRPLAGTRPRGKTAAEDLALEQDLLADQKEIAEHLMLIDLGRNDVGRVCSPGSVKVTERFVIERFSHVMHISSNVEGTLKPDLEALDALVAAFPAGTLTGAPKIRAMEIIDEVERTRRATYAGCIGYFGAGGDMDTCIGLRMAVVKDGSMHVQAGCGVVADSVPESEYEETQHKARAVFRAAEEALIMARTGRG